jgi:hypothetical protein
MAGHATTGDNLAGLAAPMSQAWPPPRRMASFRSQRPSQIAEPSDLPGNTPGRAASCPPVAASKNFNLEEHKRMLELGLHLLDDDSSKLEYEKLSKAEFEWFVNEAALDPGRFEARIPGKCQSRWEQYFRSTGSGCPKSRRMS